MNRLNICAAEKTSPIITLLPSLSEIMGEQVFSNYKFDIVLMIGKLRMEIFELIIIN